MLLRITESGHEFLDAYLDGELWFDAGNRGLSDAAKLAAEEAALRLTVDVAKTLSYFRCDGYDGSPIDYWPDEYKALSPLTIQLCLRRGYLRHGIQEQADELVRNNIMADRVFKRRGPGSGERL